MTLTAAQLETLRLAALGLRGNEIAEAVGASRVAVQSRLHRIRILLGIEETRASRARDGVAYVVVAIRMGLVTLDEIAGSLGLDETEDALER